MHTCSYDLTQCTVCFCDMTEETLLHNKIIDVKTPVQALKKDDIPTQFKTRKVPF